MDVGNSGHEYEVLEFYAGKARLAKLAKALGKNSAAMDFVYDTKGDNSTKNNSMDMNTSAGFTFLIPTFVYLFPDWIPDDCSFRLPLAAWAFVARTKACLCLGASGSDE